MVELVGPLGVGEKERAQDLGMKYDIIILRVHFLSVSFLSIFSLIRWQFPP